MVREGLRRREGSEDVLLQLLIFWWRDFDVLLLMEVQLTLYTENINLNISMRLLNINTVAFYYCSYVMFYIKLI